MINEDYKAKYAEVRRKNMKRILVTVINIIKENLIIELFINFNIIPSDSNAAPA